MKLSAALLAFSSLLGARAEGLPLDCAVERGIAHGSAESRKLDIYLPSGPIYIHGDGWEGGSKSDAGGTLPLLIDKNTAFVSVENRLTNRAVWPTQIQNGKAAMSRLPRRADEKDLEMSRAIFLGIPVGGRLVSQLGATHGGEAWDKSGAESCLLTAQGGPHACIHRELYGDKFPFEDRDVKLK